MNRDTFIKSLRKHLSFLEKEALEKEVLSYINKIDGSKLSDAEVIESFGKMDDIVKEVCKKHGLNPKTVRVHDHWFKRFYNELVDLSTVLKNSDGKKRGKILLDVFLLIVITCVLKIPFIFIRDLGDQFVGTVLSNNVTILAIWGLVIEVVYIVVALYFFVHTFEKWFQNLK